ncbi:endonuclease III domain-containing protein [Trebonia kvetii]|nr:hypothetical protein [Trebonia kvetii]
MATRDRRARQLWRTAYKSDARRSVSRWPEQGMSRASGLVHSNAMLTELTDLLIAEGQAALTAGNGIVRFTGNHDADELLNDLDGHPHAFVLAALVDRQVKAERAWMMPLLIRQRHGSFEIGDLEPLSEQQWLSLLRHPTPAHRMPETMARVLHRAIHRIRAQYSGEAAQIWADMPPSARVVRRFLEFHGAGPKIATMAANILVRGFHVPLRDYRYIDISADVHVDRVMTRLGFVEPGSSPAVVIYAARELNPDFPGIFDLALWNVGRTLCRPAQPRCPECHLRDLCAYARTGKDVTRLDKEQPSTACPMQTPACSRQGP